MTAISLTDILVASLVGVLAHLVLRILKADKYDTLPVVGHMRAVLAGPQAFMDWCVAATEVKHDQKNWKYVFPGKTSLINVEPASIAFVAANSSTDDRGLFDKTEGLNDMFRDIFSTGWVTTSILFVFGPLWRANRKAFAMFSTPRMLNHVADVILPRNAHVLIDVLDGSAGGGETADLQEVLSDWLTAVFGDLAFDASNEEIRTNFAPPYHRASNGVIRRLYTPFWKQLEMLLPYGKALHRDIVETRRAVQDMVDRMRERIKEEELGLRPVKEGSGLMMQALLSSEYEFTDLELATACFSTLVAGRDTTAHGITWAMYALLHHPGHLPRLREEIRALPPTLESNMELAAHLPFLEAFISESLRLYPPVPIIITEVVSREPVILPGGVVVYKGEQIMTLPYVMARLSVLWGPDAKEFNPDRWLATSADDASGRNKTKVRKTASENPVFSAGPRNCPGQQVSKVEMVWAMSELIRRYDFEAAWSGGPEQPRALDYDLTLRMKGGLPVKVRRVVSSVPLQ